MMRASLFFFLVTLVACGDSGSSSGTREPAGPVDAADELGPLAVGHSTFTAVDEARGGRSLLVDIWYPVDADDAEGQEPRQYTLSGLLGPVSEVALADPPVSARAEQSLLVFSHGYQGIGTSAVGLMEVLASHGFIVAAPEHTGNAQQSPTDSFDEAAENRVPDVSFLIDEMIRRNRDPDDAFHQRIDEARVGVLGHSFGGMTSIGMAAGWAGAAADPRVAAILPMSAVIVPDLQSDERNSPNAGFTRQQLEGISVPVMLMGGTEDVDVFPENNEIAFDQITNAPRVYNVEIIGANHTHFANVCWIGDYLINIDFTKDKWPALGAGDLVEPYEATCGPEAFPIERANRVMNLYTVAFFKRHLLGEEGYDTYLTTEAAEMEADVNFFRK
jgi:predicted dienelactone hydrolase